MRSPVLWLAAALLLHVPGKAMAAAGSTISVAAAADLRFALEEVVAAYRKASPGSEVRLTFGSSGNFFAQIVNGGPFDVFLSADARYPRKLVEQGAAVEGTEFLYAIGRIVVWVRAESRLDVERRGLEALLDPGVRRVGIANPDHAPYGVAAVQALRAAGVYDRVKGKLVFGQNVSQAAQFVHTGAADAGIIALSLALAPTMKAEGRYREVPPDSYARMEQGGVLLRGSRNPDAARAFMAFLRGDEARGILARYGFGLPPR